jgi:glycosyltransferase AglE
VIETIGILPFVSVVVPVLNDSRRVGLCIEALLKQTYPKDRYEVIIVDNGSTDDTRAVIGRYPVALLIEDRIQSSYAARNKGVRAARGEVIALTDADCRPMPNWIEDGVRALDAQGADLAGGHVRFVYSTRPSAAEIYDSLTNMQQEWSIRDRSYAATANLFIRTAIFAVVGMFPDTMKSGGDVYWTRRATSLGQRLIYARRAEVAHPTRRLCDLLTKHYRVGKGRYDCYLLEHAAERNGETHEIALFPATTWRLFTAVLRPPGWSRLRYAMQRHGIEGGTARLLRVWSVGWLCRLTSALGWAHRWSDYGRSTMAEATKARKA